MTAAKKLLAKQPAGGSFAPTDISGCITWLDGSDSATITSSSGKVDTWADKSSAGNDLTGVTSARPSTGTATINGLNVIDFNGSGLYMRPASNFLSGKSAATILAVIKNSDTGNRQLWEMGGASTSYHPYGGTFYENFGTGTRYDNISTTGQTLTNAYIYTVAAASSDWRAYINGSSIHSSGTNTVSFASPAGLGVGGGVYAYFAEVIIYDTALSSGDIVTVENYLQAKWGTP